MRPTRRPLVLVLLGIAGLVLVLDQATKALAVRELVEGDRTPLLGDLLGLSLLYNPGAALGIATGMTWLLTLAAMVVAVVILRTANRLGSRGWTVALGLLLGGALGNLVDRLVREPGVAQGHVVDFIAYGDWFVGNVADIAIVTAAGLVVLLSARGIGLDGSRLAGQEGATPDGEVPGDEVPGDEVPGDEVPAGDVLDGQRPDADLLGDVLPDEGRSQDDALDDEALDRAATTEDR